MEKRRFKSFQVFSCLKKKSTLGFCRLSKDRSLKNGIILYYIILYYIINIVLNYIRLDQIRLHYIILYYILLLLFFTITKKRLGRSCVPTTKKNLNEHKFCYRTQKQGTDCVIKERETLTRYWPKCKQDPMTNSPSMFHVRDQHYWAGRVKPP